MSHYSHNPQVAVFLPTRSTHYTMQKTCCCASTSILRLHSVSAQSLLALGTDLGLTYHTRASLPNPSRTSLCVGETCASDLGHFIPKSSSCILTELPGPLQSFQLTFLAIVYFHTSPMPSSITCSSNFWSMLLRRFLEANVPPPCPSIPSIKPMMLFSATACAISSHFFFSCTMSSSLTTMHYTLSTTVCTCTPCQGASFPCKTDSFLWGHGPDTLACKARPSFDRCGTSLSVSLSLSLSRLQVQQLALGSCTGLFGAEAKAWDLHVPADTTLVIVTHLMTALWCSFLNYLILHRLHALLLNLLWHAFPVSTFSSIRRLRRRLTDILRSMLNLNLLW